MLDHFGQVRRACLQLPRITLRLGSRSRQRSRRTGRTWRAIAGSRFSS